MKMLKKLLKSWRSQNNLNIISRFKIEILALDLTKIEMISYFWWFKSILMVPDACCLLRAVWIASKLSNILFKVLKNLINSFTYLISIYFFTKLKFFVLYISLKKPRSPKISASLEIGLDLNTFDCFTSDVSFKRSL
jgi:hypothetical protein